MMVKMIEEVEDRTVGGVYIFESHSERRGRARNSAGAKAHSDGANWGINGKLNVAIVAVIKMFVGEGQN
ncbi:hypothetical protein MTP99_013260 [Tenebrio molitor]|nr:hypothetical protein MTP99_013260 [Tenebrio molitor]CAH1371788.1 unnamed protein product [Tenebrio molitor]